MGRRYGTLPEGSFFSCFFYEGWQKRSGVTGHKRKKATLFTLFELLFGPSGIRRAATEKRKRLATMSCAQQVTAFNEKYHFQPFTFQLFVYKSGSPPTSRQVCALSQSGLKNTHVRIFGGGPTAYLQRSSLPHEGGRVLGRVVQWEIILPGKLAPKPCIR